MGLQSLTVKETAAAERRAKTSISALGNENKPQLPLMIALGFELMKRENPDAKIDDVEALTLPELTDLLGLDDDDDENPTQ